MFPSLQSWTLKHNKSILCFVLTFTHLRNGPKIFRYVVSFSFQLCSLR